MTPLCTLFARYNTEVEKSWSEKNIANEAIDQRKETFIKAGMS